MDFDKVLDARHSVRSFSGAKLKEKEVFAVLDAALKTPIAGNVCILKMVLVDEKIKIEEIAKACPESKFIKNVSDLFIVCSELKKAKNMYGGFGEHYAAQQAGAAIENMLLKAVDLGLASCWIGGFDESAVKRIFEIPEDYRIEAILPLGKELKPSSLKKKKTDLKEVLRYNKFSEKKR